MSSNLLINTYDQECMLLCINSGPHGIIHETNLVPAFQLNTYPPNCCQKVSILVYSLGFWVSFLQVVQEKPSACIGNKPCHKGCWTVTSAIPNAQITPNGVHQMKSPRNPVEGTWALKWHWEARCPEQLSSAQLHNYKYLILLISDALSKNFLYSLILSTHKAT